MPSEGRSWSILQWALIVTCDVCKRNDGEQGEKGFGCFDDDAEAYFSPISRVLEGLDRWNVNVGEIGH
jgi:hypothetical protein